MFEVKLKNTLLALALLSSRSSAFLLSLASRSSYSCITSLSLCFVIEVLWPDITLVVWEYASSRLPLENFYLYTFKVVPDKLKKSLFPLGEQELIGLSTFDYFLHLICSSIVPRSSRTLKRSLHFGVIALISFCIFSFFSPGLPNNLFGILFTSISSSI